MNETIDIPSSIMANGKVVHTMTDGKITPREALPALAEARAEKEALLDEVGTLNDKVWRGNGKPAPTEQMAVLSQTVRALCWLVAVTCAALRTV
mgnify:FL=1